MVLKSLVEEEFQEVGLPIKVDVKPLIDLEKSCYVQISIFEGLESGDSSFLDFLHNPYKKRLEHANLRLVKQLRGNGFGKKLVESMEEIGRKLHCKQIIFEYINPDSRDFWEEKMGYVHNGKCWEKRL